MSRSQIVVPALALVVIAGLMLLPETASVVLSAAILGTAVVLAMCCYGIVRVGTFVVVVAGLAEFGAWLHIGYLGTIPALLALLLVGRWAFRAAPPVGV